MFKQDQSAGAQQGSPVPTTNVLAECLANPQPNKHFPMFWESYRLPDDTHSPRVLPLNSRKSGRS